MKCLIILALAVATASAAKIYQRDVVAPVHESDGRITNGNTASAGQFPYQVGLSTGYSELTFAWCGGALIGSQWVLTAAHCVEDKYSVMVYLGATDRSSPEVTYSVLYTEIIIYPDWNSKNMQHDIALIKIPAVSFSKRIQPIALPSIIGTYSTYAGDYAIASGWGRTSDTASGNTEELQWARMQVISNTECADTFGAKITSSVICVSTTGGVSTCNGDSGGPLVLESTQELIGLTSFGAIAGCGWGFPAAFTRLTSYLGWIQSNTGIYYYH